MAFIQSSRFLRNALALDAAACAATGLLLSLGAGSLASREGQGKAVVVSASDFAFPGAMQVGDELSVYCAIAATGTTSLTITAEAIARERNGEAETKVAQGTFKFVLLDENDRPRAVAGVARAR